MIMPVSEISAVDPSNFAVVSPGFDLESYLQQQNQDPNFVMVEFGHGACPVAYQQPGKFTGQRSYIGIEAWLHDSDSEARSDLQALQTQHPGLNITYIEQRLSKNGENDGPYDPTTILPDGAADEILLCNVFGDGPVADFGERTQHLLKEVGRLTADNGIVVVGETITPKDARRRLTAQALQSAGLRTIGLYTEGDQAWERLEQLYGNGAWWVPLEPCFYQFLAKAATAPARL